MPRTVLSYDRHALGLTWVLDEPMQRASHALADDGRVWLVDPVEAGEALDRVARLGEPAGVIQLLDRHGRDCAALARRLGVPHLRVPRSLPATPFEVLPVVSVRGWREVALWWPAREALVVADAVATGPMYAPPGQVAGVHVFLRPRPPGSLRDRSPRHLLVGHGEAVHGPRAQAALREAYARSRRDLPLIVARLPRVMRG
jgi:hypothetical protein